MLRCFFSFAAMSHFLLILLCVKASEVDCTGMSPSNESYDHSIRRGGGESRAAFPKAGYRTPMIAFLSPYVKIWRLSATFYVVLFSCFMWYRHGFSILWEASACEIVSLDSLKPRINDRIVKYAQEGFIKLSESFWCANVITAAPSHAKVTAAWKQLSGESTTWKLGGVTRRQLAHLFS